MRPAVKLDAPAPRRWLSVVRDPRDAYRCLANVCEAIWRIGDWRDQQGEAQFAVAGAWMEDISLWEDVQEDNGYFPAKEDDVSIKPRAPRTPRSEQIERIVAAANEHGGRLEASQIRAALQVSRGHALKIAESAVEDGVLVLVHRGRGRDPSIYALPDQALVPVAKEPEPVSPEPDLEPVRARGKRRKRNGVNGTAVPDWAARIKLLADWERKPVEQFVDDLLSTYQEVNK